MKRELNVLVKELDIKVEMYIYFLISALDKLFLNIITIFYKHSNSNNFFFKLQKRVTNFLLNNTGAVKLVKQLLGNNNNTFLTPIIEAQSRY